MSYSNPKDQKAFHKEWYKRNKDRLKLKAKTNNKEYKKRNRDYVRAIKEASPCKDCGKKYPHYVMDFDHLVDKTANISRLVINFNSIESIQKEIDKCELVCSNCHRIRTWNRNNA